MCNLIWPTIIHILLQCITVTRSNGNLSCAKWTGLLLFINQTEGEPEWKTSLCVWFSLFINSNTSDYLLLFWRLTAWLSQRLSISIVRLEIPLGPRDRLQKRTLMWTHTKSKYWGSSADRSLVRDLWTGSVAITKLAGVLPLPPGLVEWWSFWSRLSLPMTVLTAAEWQYWSFQSCLGVMWIRAKSEISAVIYHPTTTYIVRPCQLVLRPTCSRLWPEMFMTHCLQKTSQWMIYQLLQNPPSRPENFYMNSRSPVDETKNVPLGQRSGWRVSTNFMCGLVAVPIFAMGMSRKHTG